MSEQGIEYVSLCGNCKHYISTEYIGPMGGHMVVKGCTLWGQAEFKHIPNVHKVTDCSHFEKKFYKTVKEVK